MFNISGICKVSCFDDGRRSLRIVDLAGGPCCQAATCVAWNVSLPSISWNLEYRCRLQ